jgi:hypothetical protein
MWEELFMKRKAFEWAGLLSCLALAIPLLAQTGHPLKGSWSGDWGPTPDHRNRVLLLLDWDGNEITGVINPGPNPVPITSAELDVDTWTVTLEADARGRGGETVHYVIEGKVENLGSWTNRTISGTWRHGNETGDFKVTLN